MFKIQNGGHSPTGNTRKIALVLTKIWFVYMCALHATQLSLRTATLTRGDSLPFWLKVNTLPQPGKQTQDLITL